jgi:GNAT superfamily N-acetyltransferase
MTAGLDLRRVAFGDPVVQELVAAVQEEYVVRYGSPDETPIDASVFDPPGGAFFLGSLEGVPVAIGGWRFRSDVAALGGSRAAEVKRMYVVPSARRAGHARVFLAHLEDTAREAGADVMVLETGLRQPEALALYRTAGYLPVDGFGFYKEFSNVRYLGKRL